MIPTDCARLADALLPALLHAGRIEMAYFAGGVAVERKADSTPVTAADREAEAVIVAALAAAAPGVPVIAEEASAAGHRPQVGERFFLVDPLDGTREFVAGRGEFTINVAMIEGGRPVLGIVYAPALGKLYAALGAGCAVTADVAVDSPARRIAELSPRPIAAREPRPDALVAVVSRSHGTEATNAYLARFRLAGSRSAGSSLKFCLIAEGGADVYPRHGTTSEWDTAAGHAVLEAAGGSVLTLDGAPLRYGKAAAGFLNPHFVAWGRRVVEPGADAAASGA